MRTPRLSPGCSAVLSRLIALLLVCFAHPAASAAPEFGEGYFGRILAQGPASHAAAGIRFDFEGRLWVACIVDHTLRRLDAKTGEILEEIPFDQGVRTPDDVTFAPDGTLYWTNFITGDIGRRTPSGEVSSIANIGEGANGIVALPDGRLFASRFLVGDDLFEIDPKGSAPPRLVASGFPDFEGLAAGPDGAIYAALVLSGQILRIDPDTGQQSIFVQGLEGPVALRFRGEDLFVLEYPSGRVQRWSPKGDGLDLVVRAGRGADGIDLARDGSLYVSSWANGSIDRFVNGRRRNLVEAGPVAPGALAIIESRAGPRIWTAELSTLQGFDALLGQELGRIPSAFGEPTAGVSLPFSVATDGDALLTTSWFTNLVQVLEPSSGKVLEAYESFAVPMNAIALGSDLIVAEAGTGAVVRLDRATGERSVLGDGFVLPVGLATDGSSIWVGDWGAGAVWTLVDRGQRLDPPRLRASDLILPEGIAVDARGTLYVNETGRQRVVAIDPEGAHAVVVRGLQPDIPIGESEVALPTWILADVAVSRAGILYVSDPAAAQILQILPID